MKRAINLARVSTPQQAKLYSLDHQLELERAYDAEMGFTIVAEFKDDTSGRKLERDGLEQACLMLENDEADILVVWKFDRLHRHFVNSVLMRERIRKAGKEIHYAQSKTISGRTARQRLPEDLQFLMAEIEADDIEERRAQGTTDKARAGKWVGLNKPPYGYSKVGTAANAQMVINESQAEVIRDIFTWFVEDDVSTLDIAKKLSALGVPTPDDNSPRQNLKKRGYGQWSRTGLIRLMHQPAYMGEYQNFRWKKIGGKLVANPNKDEIVSVSVPAIISPTLYEQAQEKLSRGRAESSRGAKYEYLVGQRIRCECGYRMRGTTSKNEYTRLDGQTTVSLHGRYRCPSFLSTAHIAVKTCTMPAISQKQLDARVWQWVKEDIGSPVVLERKLREVQEGQRESMGNKQTALDTLYAHKQEIEDELKRIGGLFGKPGMPSRIVDDMIAQEGHKLQLTEAEIRKTEQEMQTPLTDEAIESLLLFSMDFAKHLEATEATLEGRRTVIRGLDVTVEVFRENEEIMLRCRSILRPRVKELPLTVSPLARSR